MRLRARLTAIGAELGQRETLALGDAANRHSPELKTHDRHGQRRDEVEFHPAWHALLALALKYGLHSAPWNEPVSTLRQIAVAHHAGSTLLRATRGHQCKKLVQLDLDRFSQQPLRTSAQHFSQCILDRTRARQLNYVIVPHVAACG